jgi:hypothetical protein
VSYHYRAREAATGEEFIEHMNHLDVEEYPVTRLALPALPGTGYTRRSFLAIVEINFLLT